jgi:hypothetical protein
LGYIFDEATRAIDKMPVRIHHNDGKGGNFVMENIVEV